MQFHVNPASTRPRSSTSLRKHRGRGDFSGSSIRSHGRRFSFLGGKIEKPINLNYDATTLNYDHSGLRRNT